MQFLVQILSRLPLGLLYFFADYLVYPVCYYLIGYRKQLVRKNLANAFPAYSGQQLRKVEKGFYHHFADTIVEIMYGYRATDKEMQERVVFHGLDEIISQTKLHNGSIMMLGHLGNWEWLADYANRMRPHDIQTGVVYRKLRSDRFDAFMRDIRNKRGGFLIEKKQVLRQMVKQRSLHIDTTYTMLADQKPSPQNQHYWTTFLHQDTPFLTGSEVLGQKFGYPVYYVHILSPKRGHYEIDFVRLDEPEQPTPFMITERYARLLEQNIQEQPEQWLWTHNRWKYKREVQ